MSRLTIDITDQQHQRLKALAALQGKSIKQYAVERLFPAPMDDDPAWRELTALLQQRVAEGLRSSVSAKSFDDVVDEELRRESRA